MSGPSHPQPPTPPADPEPGPAEGAGPLVRPARLILVGTWTILVLAHLCFSPGQRLRTWPMSYLLLEVLATLSLGFRVRQARREDRAAWTLLAVSAFLEVPNLVLTFLVRGQHSAATGTLSSLLTMATGLLALGGILSFPQERRHGGMFLRRVLDGLIFATSVLFLLWIMGVQASLHSPAGGLGLRMAAAYLNAALLGAGLVFLTSYHPERIRGPLGWLGASALAWIVSLSCWTLAGLPAVPATQAWIVFAGAIPLFQGLAAWSPTPGAGARTLDRAGRKAVRWLPYLPVLLAVAALAVLLPGAPLGLMRGAFGIFLGMVVLLLLRQFQAVRDLQAARRSLEDRVQQRTQALERAQEALLRTERMNTLALMGAGLAHDLNNLLAAVKSSAELASLDLDRGAVPTAETLSRIAAAADRAATLTGRLMGFVRREKEDLAPTDLGHELREIEATLRLLIPRTVDLSIEVSPTEPLLVQSSRLRLEQILVNLVANARDAMPAGGRLTIQAGPTASGRGEARIEVSDSGIGMPPAVLARIFDPFFTTKPQGMGTGLGLPSIKALVEECGGRLEVASEAGRGTRFSIILPRLPLD